MRSLPDDAVRYGSGIASVLRHSGGVVVGLSDGSSAKGDVLVGADGVGSTVRASVGGAGSPSDALLAGSSWRFVAPDFGVDCWTLWAGRAGMVLLIPLNDGEVYGWVTTAEPGGGRVDGAPLSRAFVDFPDVVRQTLSVLRDGDSTLVRSPLQEVRSTRWSDGSVVLIGDAAHATAPVWAQGAALGLEDAEVLAELLLREQDWSLVGPSFEERRRSRVEHVRSATDRMSRSARLPEFLKQLLLPVMGPRSYAAAYGPLRSL